MLCCAEEEKAAAAAEAAASAREATPEVSEEGEIAVDPEELEEISKAQQQAASKQVHPQPHHHPAAKQASDRGRDRDRDRGVDRDRGHPGQERQAFGVNCSGLCPHLACESCTAPRVHDRTMAEQSCTGPAPWQTSCYMYQQMA